MREFKYIFQSLRKEANYSQAEIAKLLFVSRATIAMWETGERVPRKEKMEEIGDFFNVDMDFLYGKTDIKRKISFDERGNEVIFRAFEATANTYGMLDDDEIAMLRAYRKADDLHKQMVKEILGVK